MNKQDLREEIKTILSNRRQCDAECEGCKSVGCYEHMELNTVLCPQEVDSIVDAIFDKVAAYYEGRIMSVKEN